MARLNEAPPPTESVEALKRRFLRQNRELAKINSNQSLRISALETETSRLLAENTALREEIIHLQSQLEGSQAIEFAKFTNIKDNLEVKIREFNALIADLGTLQKGGNEKTHSTGPQGSSEGRCRPKRPPKLDMEADQEGRLPTIEEDKSYPQESSRPEDNPGLRLSDQTNESPDIGPPPVAHFECDDPIKFEPRRTGQDHSDNTDAADETMALPANLETRRRRRESNTRFDSKKFHVFESSPLDKNSHSSAPIIASEPVNSQPTLKAGAKRKLNARDTIVSTNEGMTKPAEDFHYSRKVVPDAGTTMTDLDTSQNAAAEAEKRTETQRPGMGDRKVLADKTANMSPRKSATVTANHIKESLKATRQTKADTEGMAVAKPSTVAPKHSNKDSMETAIQAPKTPAFAELVSPASTVISTAETDSRDTPPPSQLSATSTLRSGNEAAARTARRARAQVNYAEPNLVSKMRRPNKGFLDAVLTEDRHQGNANVATETSPSNSDCEKAKMRTVIVRREDSSVDWNRRPAPADTNAHSPLGQKASAVALQPIEPLDIPGSVNVVANGGGTGSKDSEVSTLAAASKRKRDGAMTDERPVDDAIGKLESLNIYEINESSPRDVMDSANPQMIIDTRSKFSRRDSSTLHPPNRTGATKHPTSKSGSVNPLQQSKRPNQQGLTRTTGVSNLSDKADPPKQSQKGSPEGLANVEAGRSERAARRRSMML